jgi:hypothetical protein
MTSTAKLRIEREALVDPMSIRALNDFSDAIRTLVSIADYFSRSETVE